MRRSTNKFSHLDYQLLQPRQMLVAGIDVALFQFATHTTASPDLGSTDQHVETSVSEISSALPLSSTGNGEPPRGLALGGAWNETSEPTPAGGQDDYFEFTISPDAGYEMNLSRFSMMVRKNDADSKDSFSVYFDDDPSSGGNNFATKLLSATITSEDVFETLSADLESIPEFSGLTTNVTFRVYSWGTAGLGTARLDNIRVQAVQETVENSVFAYYGDADRLIHPLDELGNRVADFSAAGFRNGNEAVPDVTQLIDSSRVVNVFPVAGDDMASIQAALDQVGAMSVDGNGFRGIVQLSAGEFEISNQVSILNSGVIFRGVGDGADPATSTILRGTGTLKRDLVVVGHNSGNEENAVPNTTHNIVDKYVPVGATSFQVDATTNWSVGDSVVVFRPSTSNWISDLGMDMIPERDDGGQVIQWEPGRPLDQYYERVIERIEGNRIFINAPLMNAIEQQYGGGTVFKSNYGTPRLTLVGIENVRGVSDFVSDTDEDHAESFIQLNAVEDAWVTNVTGEHFVYATIHAASRSRRVTVDDAQSLDPKSIITGGRRYPFTIDGSYILMKNLYSEDGRHDFINNSPWRNRGPNVFLDGVAVNSNSSSGPHQRWSTGTLYDSITTDNVIEARNRGNYGTGHGWAGANMVFWNSTASTYIAQNPPTAQNWVIGGTGVLGNHTEFGQQEPATFDAHGTPIDFGRVDNPTSSLYVAQRLRADADSFYQSREYVVGDFDLGVNDGTGSADEVYVDSTWFAEVTSVANGSPVSDSDVSIGGQFVPFSFDYSLATNERVFAAVLSIGLRGTGGDTTDDLLWVESLNSPQTFASMGLVDSLLTDETRVLTVEFTGSDLDMLNDGLLNLAISGDSVLDWSTVEILVGNGVSSIADSNVAANDVAEDVAIGALVGLTALATDADAEDSVSYELTNDSGGRFSINGATGVVTVAAALDFESNSSHTIEVQATSTDGSTSLQQFQISVSNVNDASVLARSIFYNGSDWDSAADVDAVASDKFPLFEGSIASFANYTSYELGINGIIVEVNDLNEIPTLATIGDFFEFRVGNTDTPSTWATAPAPVSLAFEADVVSGVVDRITLVWDDHAIRNQWLQVKLLGNEKTGLPTADTFYFGNVVGETGNSTANAIVNIVDIAGVRINQTGFGSTDIENNFDFNRDKKVNIVDLAISRLNQSGFSSVRLIDLTENSSKIFSSGTTKLFHGQLTVAVGSDLVGFSSNHARIFSDNQKPVNLRPDNEDLKLVALDASEQFTQSRLQILDEIYRKFDFSKDANRIQSTDVGRPNNSLLDASFRIRNWEW